MNKHHEYIGGCLKVKGLFNLKKIDTKVTLLNPIGSEQVVDKTTTVIKYANKTNKILLRKRQLFNQLSDKKLEYIKNGICDSYIKYGKPSLNDVIDNIQSKTEAKARRLNMLLIRLHNENEKYDENNSYYSKYINNGGNLNEIINEGIKEWFYINKTNYLHYLKLYKNEDVAQTKAFNAYIKNHGHDKYTERIIKSEMVLRLY